MYNMSEKMRKKVWKQQMLGFGVCGIINRSLASMGVEETKEKRLYQKVVTNKR